MTDSIKMDRRDVTEPLSHHLNQTANEKKLTYKSFWSEGFDSEKPRRMMFNRIRYFLNFASFVGKPVKDIYRYFTDRY